MEGDAAWIGLRIGQVDRESSGPLTEYVTIEGLSEMLQLAGVEWLAVAYESLAGFGRRKSVNQVEATYTLMNSACVTHVGHRFSVGARDAQSLPDITRKWRYMM